MTPPSSFRLTITIAITLAVWGTAFAFMRVALHAFSPGGLSFLRYAVASLTLLVLAAWNRPSLPRRDEWLRLIAVALTGITGYNLLLNYGLETVGAGPGAFINNTIPLFSTLLAIVLLGERPSWVAWLGMTVCLAGVGLIAVGEAGGGGLAIGALLLLGSAISYAAYTVIQKPLLAERGPVWVVSWAIWIGTALLAPWAGDAVGAVGRAGRTALVAVAFLGVCSAAVGFLLWSWCLQHIRVSTLSPVLYFVPVISLVTAWAWLDERPSALSLSGCAVVAGGVLLSTRILARGPAILPS